MNFRDLHPGDAYYYPFVPDAVFCKITDQTMAPETAFEFDLIAEERADQFWEGWRMPEDPRQRVVRVGHRDDWARAQAWRVMR